MPAPVHNPWFGVSMALIGVIIGYAVAVMMGGNLPMAGTPTAPNPTPTAQQPTPSPTAGDVPAVTDDDYIRGNRDVTITLIEYSDFECPFCTRHHPTMEQLLEDYGDQVNWVYRHYPLSFHPNAHSSAQAAECVGEVAGNDAFWAFADILFEMGTNPSNYRAQAEEAGADGDAWQDCYDSETFVDLIDDQMAKGSAAGVRGTPGTFVVNNETDDVRYVSGAQPVANFKAEIDALLN